MSFAIKSIIKPLRVPDNKYSLIVQPGVGQLTVVELTGLEQELDQSELPDRTVRSGGRGKPLAFDFAIPMHHTSEVLLCETWWNLCKYSLIGYLKFGMLIQFNEASIPTKRWTLPNLWLTKRGHTDLALGNDGEMTTIMWSASADDLISAG